MLVLALCLGVTWPPRGFTAASASLERNYEQSFKDMPSSQGALDASTFLNSQPHYPGTTGDKNVAIYMRDRLRDYGFTAELEEFTGRVDTPKKLELDLLTSPKVVFHLNELAISEDPSTARTTDVGPPFNYGSGDGDVTAQLVYANRGLDEDYATLAASHIEVRGKILLIRYGAEFRGT